MDPFPYQEELKNLSEGEKVVIFWNDRPYIIQAASDDDLEKIGQGYFCLNI